MDLTDPAEGYNSYYIGKKGDVRLEIVDWRAPLARRYYQKSRIAFSINQYDYKTVLRRALRTKEGRVLDFKNEFLSVRDYLTPEEIGGRDEEILFDPYLREIIRNRKEEPPSATSSRPFRKAIRDHHLSGAEKFCFAGMCGQRKDDGHAPSPQLSDVQ